MSGTTKKEYTPILEMTTKKTKYEKALEYYGLQGKSPTQVASNLKVRVRFSKGQNIKSIIENEVINRWKEDSKKVMGIYTLTFKKYNSKEKRYEEGAITFNAKGDKRDIQINAQLAFQGKIDYLMKEYPEWKDFDYSKKGMLEIGDKVGSGVDNGKTITTTKGGQRKVGMRGNKAVIKMKDRFALKFADDDEQDWDRGEGTCVFDYLYKYYRCKELGTEKKPKLREKAYEWLNDLLKIEIDTENPLVDGVSVYQLENFCDFYGCNMYCYAEDDGLIEFYKPKKSHNRDPLIFRVYDGHFNPFPPDKRRSASAKATSTGQVVVLTNDIEKYETKANEKEYEVIAPSKEEYNAIKEELKEKNYPVSVRNQVAMDYLKKNGLKVPYPLNSTNITIEDNSIVKLVYDDKVVLTEPIDENVSRWYKDNGLSYKGQSPVNILNQIYYNKYGFDLYSAPFLSNPNVEVLNALSEAKVKWRTHLGITKAGKKYSEEKIKELLITGEAISVDICKCYCDALYNPRERWIVFNGKEVVEAYDRRPLTLGLYFVQTEDMTLFHKSNWYSKQIIDKAREEGIKYWITHQIRCVDVKWEKTKVDEETMTGWWLENDDLFKDIIDEIVEITEQDEDFTLTKLLINSISGFLGKTQRIKRTACINTKLNEIWENWIIDDVDGVVANGDDIYLSELKSDDLTLYVYGVEKKEEMLSTGLPMYIQVLDSANIALYDMIKAVGGKCIYRKTDCIVSVGGVLPESMTIKYPCDYQDTWGCYRLVDDAVNYNYVVEMNEERAVRTPRLKDDWRHYDFNDSDDWDNIIRTAKEKGGMMISGRAGTGKSYVIEQGIKAGLLPEDPKTRMALTNRAARNINGTTIHKNMAINNNNKTNAKTLQGLCKYDTFIVDEISMLSSDLWNKLCLLKKRTGATFIIMGDHRQCPPIENGKEIDYFNHPYAKYLTNNNCCELTTPKRYDMDLWNWLEDFYERDIVGEKVIKREVSIEDMLNRKNIVYMNDTRKKINATCMEYVVSQKSYTPITLGLTEKTLEHNPYAQEVSLYIGLPVMSVKNNADMGIINSEEFWVKDIKSNEGIIEMYRDEDEDDVISVEMKSFHNYFVVNYAATTHKSQGATIDKGINIWDWSVMEDVKKLGYTAVSRAKKCEQVWLVEDDN